MWKSEFDVIEKQMSEEIGDLKKLNDVYRSATPTRREMLKSIISKLLQKTVEIMTEMRKNQDIISAFQDRGSGGYYVNTNNYSEEKRKLYVRVYEFRTKTEIAITKLAFEKHEGVTNSTKVPQLFKIQI